MIILVYFLILYFHMTGCHELYHYSYQQPYALAPDGYYEQESQSASSDENSDEITPQTHHGALDFVIDYQKTMKENVDLFHKELLKKRDCLLMVCCEQVFPWKLFCKHVNANHCTQKKQVVCPVELCAKEFKTVNHGHLHIARHQHPELLTCPVCKDQFSAIGVIKKHCIICWEKYGEAQKKNKLLPIYTQIKNVIAREHPAIEQDYCPLNAYDVTAYNSLYQSELDSDN